MKITLKKLIFFLTMAALCLIAIIGAAIYFFYSLDWLGVSFTLILSGTGLWLFVRLFARPKKETLNTGDIAEIFIDKKTKTSRKKMLIAIAWLIPYLVFLLFTFYFLLRSRADAALTSPWQVVPVYFFIFYLLATAYLFWLIIKNSRLTLYLVMAHYFLSFSVLWIVFKIGYGFDPFIHQATLDLIDKQGFVLPKTPYYLGQYSLILIAHKIFFIPIAWLDKLLVPALAAITLPPAIYLFLKKTLSSGALCSLLSVLCLLILPFSIFTLTVPQNLAYLFLLLSIFFSLLAATASETALSFLLAAAALVIHPVAGIPAILFALAAFINRQPANVFCFAPKNKSENSEICLERPREGVLRIKTIKIFGKKKFNLFSLVRRLFAGRRRKENGSILKKLFSLKNLCYAVIFILAAAVLPWLFYLTGKNSSAAAVGGASGADFSLPGIVFPRQQNILLNFVYFFLANEWLILIILAIAAAYAVYRWRHKFPQLILLAGLAVSLLIAYFITRQLNFDFLISYERNDYAARILIDAFIFISPVLAVMASELLGLILSAKPAVKYSWLALIVILITVSLYGSYPRQDNYYNSRSVSVGAVDLDAVNWINRNSSTTPYVVLADQQVSVAALWTFGFSHYFNEIPSREGCRSEAEAGCVKAGKTNNPIYFYPIPTGGPLYQIYLDMVYKKPDRATALQAADLTGANTVYFVINKYWTSFDKIVEQAKIEADSWQNIKSEIYIFKYQK
jgi:hypothetical protein